MGIDPRGARFGAIVSTIVLALVLVTGSGWLLAAQTLVFALGAALGLRYAPYGMIFRRLIRPRLGPPRELEAEPPPRFAQGVGAVFGVIGVIGYGTGVSVLGMAATAAALAAAFLNAAFGFCLGCEMYLMIQRIRTSGRKGAVHRT
jgi:hypothetical protein